jgi:hypothetical protein
MKPRTSYQGRPTQVHQGVPVQEKEMQEWRRRAFELEATLLHIAMTDPLDAHMVAYEAVKRFEREVAGGE